MGRKRKEFNLLETEQKMLRDVRIQAIKDNHVRSRLSNFSSKDPYNYNNLITWLYGKVKEYIPVENRENIDKLSTMTVIKQLSEGNFETFLDLLCQYEMRISLEESTVSEPEEILSKPGHIFPSDKGYGKIEEPTVPVPDYISFSISHYALTDVIEELYNSDAKDIIVTKRDNNLVVKYKPNWKA